MDAVFPPHPLAAPRGVSRIMVAATFTADPVAAPLQFFLDELALPAAVEILPFGQVFQPLLDPAGALAGAALAVVLVRLADLGADLDAAATDLARAVAAAAGRAGAEVLLCFCPPPPGSPSTDALERGVADALAGVPRAAVVTAAALASLYPVAAPHDPTGDALGKLPYTPSFFAALGALAARRWHALAAPPYKVIAVDCDETLWGGVCGEDGPGGVRLDAPYLALQRSLLAAREAGMLLCLASKNDAADVDAVFAARPEMPLRPEHVSARRVDWRPKPEGLRALARELGVGLDAFVFLDDNPVERAAVRAACPEVLTPELPADPAAVPAFLRHLWALDAGAGTAEDRARAALYAARAERAAFEQAAPTLEAFLEGLALQVTLTPLAPDGVARAAQLTRRTNQMNTGAPPFADADLAAALASGALEGVVADVRDRFGDYGAVGLALFAPDGAALHVSTFLLSCRALGRGVEHRLVAHLGDLAARRGLARVDVPVVATAKNRPARDLLDAAFAPFREPAGEGCVYRVPTARAAAARELPLATPPSPEQEPAPAGSAPDADARRRAETLDRIARELSDPERIRAAVDRHGQRARRASAPFLAPRSELEATIAAVFAEVLGVAEVGVHDGFFELGGHSVGMIRVLSRIRDALGVDLGPDVFFAGPTVEQLASAVTARRAGAAPAADVEALLDLLEGLSADEARALVDTHTDTEAPAPHADRAPPSPAPHADRAPAPSPAPHAGARIAAIGFCTCDRPEGIARALDSYLDNAARHGRAFDMLVTDDSRTPDGRARTRGAIAAVARTRGVTLRYAGAPQKAAYARALAARGIDPAVARFAVTPEILGGTTIGANRNGLLLDTVGDPIFWTDDDTVARVCLPPEPRAGLRLASGGDAADHWFFSDHAAALAAAPPVDRDAMAQHEALLGRTVADLAADGADRGDADATLRARLDAPGAAVHLSLGGLLGDTGWGAPFGYWHAPMGYLAMRGRSLERLASSAERYATLTQSRQILRVVDRPTLSDTGFSMTTFAGLDNRALTPPVCPVGRVDDIVFCAVLWRCFPRAAIAHVPSALLHAPVTTRRFWAGEMTRTAAGVDFCRVLTEAVKAADAGDADDPATRLRALGRSLTALGAGPQAAYDAFITARLRASGSAFVAWLDDRLAADGRAYPWWAADVTRYRDLLVAAMKRDDHDAPLDLAGGGGAVEARARGREAVRRFGELLSAWPDLVTAARDLRAAGHRLAVPVDEATDGT
jgi:FkbH-like protein